MDFSSNAFRPKPAKSTLSDDTMSHAQMVMACRFGWSAGPNTTGAQAPPTSTSSPNQAPSTSSSFPDTRFKRFAPCRGRLYHQLSCSHRIRTDLVEDCSSNCLEPFGNTSTIPFYCHECVTAEATKILEQREADHNASYPPMDQMTKEHYEQWYDEYRQLEVQFARDRKVYEMELRANSRPSNVCSVLEASKEQMDFAAELDSLSLSLMSSNDSAAGQIQPQIQPRQRLSLPNDASEQLHWNLNSLAIDRGACGVEYSASQPTNGVSTLRVLTDEELWRKPRQRN